MKKNENGLWRFFASVKLALFSLFVLAATSIVGTLIPQKNPIEFYVDNFGPRLARFLVLLDIPDMYGAWWFVALLFLFSVNLVVCTIDRLPWVWRMVVANNLDTSPEQLEKMSKRKSFEVQAEPAAISSAVTDLLGKAGWHSRASDDRTLHFAQKCAWSRLGVYVVHLSILVIFAGAIIGSVAGFKASVMITEGDSTGVVHETGTGKEIPLGFFVRCDDFSISYYGEAGTPKEFRSALTITDPVAKKEFQRPIIVNDPLDYRGITFYQSSYEPLQGFAVTINRQGDAEPKTFRIPFGEKISWPGTNIEFGLINQQARSRMGDVIALKFWLYDGQGEPSTFWLDNDSRQTVTRPSGTYEVGVSQLYATGLQVAKDPGVWVVYIGCILMLVGLYVAFFLSHRRIWVRISEEAGQRRVLLCGNANKNKLAFEKEFATLAAAFETNPMFTSTKEQHS